MGIEPYLVASGVVCVVAQRLVRRLCECKAPVELTAELLREQGFDADEGFEGFEPVGCVRCNNTGYRGRLGIYEVMPITDELRRLILESAGADVMRVQARQEGMRTLREDGLEKIRDGDTSVPEVLRVAGSSAA
jgi:type IV pilus assembly protein PilB